jgi:hypothetical protein
MAPRILCDRSPSRSNNDNRRTSYPQATRLDWSVRRGRGFGVRSKPRVKICCIASLDEAWASIASGASALGLVSWMPSGPRSYFKGAHRRDRRTDSTADCRFSAHLRDRKRSSSSPSSVAAAPTPSSCAIAQRSRGLPRTTPGVAGRGRGPGDSCDRSGKPRPNPGGHQARAYADSFTNRVL